MIDASVKQRWVRLTSCTLHFRQESNFASQLSPLVPGEPYLALRRETVGGRLYMGRGEMQLHCVLPVNLQAAVLGIQLFVLTGVLIWCIKCHTSIAGYAYLSCCTACLCLFSSSNNLTHFILQITHNSLTGLLAVYLKHSVLGQSRAQASAK